MSSQITAKISRRKRLCSSSGGVADCKSMETSAFLKKPPRRFGGSILFAFWEHQEAYTPQWRLESAVQRKERDFLEGAHAWAG